MSIASWSSRRPVQRPDACWHAWQASAASALQEQLAAADVLGSQVTPVSVAWLHALACLVAAVRQEGAAVEVLAQAWAAQKPALLSDSFRCAHLPSAASTALARTDMDASIAPASCQNLGLFASICDLYSGR